MAARGEGMGTSIGGLGVARCGRSGTGSRESAWHEEPEVRCWEAGTRMGHTPRKGHEGVTDEVGGWANGRTGAGSGAALAGGVTARVEVGKHRGGQEVVVELSRAALGRSATLQYTWRICRLDKWSMHTQATSI